jgi:hypothetical protein
MKSVSCLVEFNMVAPVPRGNVDQFGPLPGPAISCFLQPIDALFF